MRVYVHINNKPLYQFFFKTTLLQRTCMHIVKNSTYVEHWSMSIWYRYTNKAIEKIDQRGSHIPRRGLWLSYGQLPSFWLKFLAGRTGLTNGYGS